MSQAPQAIRAPAEKFYESWFNKLSLSEAFKRYWQIYTECLVAGRNPEEQHKEEARVRWGRLTGSPVPSNGLAWPLRRLEAGNRLLASGLFEFRDGKFHVTRELTPHERCVHLYDWLEFV